MFRRTTTPGGRSRIRCSSTSAVATARERTRPPEKLGWSDWADANGVFLVCPGFLDDSYCASTRADLRSCGRGDVMAAMDLL